MILKTVIQQEISNAKRCFLDTSRNDVYWSGTWANHFSPTILWVNGATYALATKAEPNRSPLLYRYGNGQIDSVQVGTITKFDTTNLYHPKSSIVYVDGHFYVGVINGHGEELLVFKSNTSNITDGFNLEATVNGEFGYISGYYKDGRIVWLTRQTAPPNGYYKRVIYSNINDYSTYTNLQTTQGSTSFLRHYPTSPKLYGYNEWYYFCVGLRNGSSSPSYYYNQVIYKTKDFETFYSLDENLSKNLSVSPFTQSELDNELSVVRNSSNTYNIGTPIGFVLNDVYYGSYWNEDDDYLRFFKYDSSVRTDYPCYIPDLSQDQTEFRQLQLYYNGKNIVIVSSALNKIYTCSLNFSNQQEVFDFSNQTELELSAGLPQNFDEVVGNYIICGKFDVSNVYTPSPPVSNFPYIETQDKFIR